MPAVVQWPASPALIRRMEEIRLAAAPTSKTTGWVKNDIRIICEADHEDKMLRGVDRYGVPRAHLAESTLKKPRANPNSLIPHGLASRVIQNYESEWDGDVLVQRWVGIRWIVYHLTGAEKAGTRWRLPRRDVSGITPKGWAKVIQRHKEFAEDVLKGR